MASRPGRLGVGVVGAGRVGAVLGSALRAAGHAVVGASGISEDSKERIATLLAGVPHLDVPEIVERSELVLLTVRSEERRVGNECRRAWRRDGGYKRGKTS